MDEAAAKQIAKNAGRIDKLVQKQLKKRNASPHTEYHEWYTIRDLHSESEWRVQLCR